MKNCIAFIVCWPLMVVAQSPGGVGTSQLKLWNKANAGIATSGSAVTAWADQTSTNTFTVTGTPVLQSSALNYNPTVLFDGNSRFTGNSTIGNITHAFAVGNIAGNRGALLGTTTGSDNNSFQYFFHTQTNNLYSAGNIGGVYTYFSYGSNTIPYSIFAEDLGKTPAANDAMRLNGLNLSNDGTNDPEVIESGTPLIGARTALRDPENIADGSAIAEAIVFTTSLSDDEVKKVESYLAIKYGITLPYNYVDAGGTTVYNVLTYGSGVMGIGRNDASALLQKQSHTPNDTTRLYLSTLANNNAANGGTVSNGAFVMAGNNGGEMFSTGSTEYPGELGIYRRLDREWKVTNTGYAGSFAMDFKPKYTNVTASDLRILVDDDGDFTNATMLTGNDAPSIAYNDGVITVSGINNTMIPTNSTRYITLASLSVNTPLPVTLTAFTASAMALDVDLKWTTAQEWNNAYFAIERSANSSNWKQLATVPGAGNSSVPVNYSYTDDKPLNGISYYRLKQTDYDGTFEYSPVRGVRLQAATVRIYPNPVRNEVTIEGGENPSVFNQSGAEFTRQLRVISRRQGKTVYSMSALPAGMYFFKINGRLYKVAKER